MEPLQHPKGSDRTKRMGRRPSARAKRAPMTETVSIDTAQEGVQCDGIDQRDRRKEKAEGMLRTKPESVSKAHRRSGQGHHQEGARDGMSERLRQGLQLRNKREKGVRPPKGKDQAEREELSQTRCRREDHSKRPGSPRTPRESSGRGQSPTRRRSLQAQKTTCRQEAVQSRWTRKRTYGQWSTMERSKNLLRPAASARTTRKEGASGCRAQRGASDQGSNPIRRDLG